MIFSFLLAAVVLYWLLVLIGTLDVEIGDVNLGDGIGLGGVPVTISASVLIVVAWFVALAGTVSISGLGTLPHTLLGIALLVVAVLAGTVTGEFGQAEVTAADGSSAIIQVRQTGEHTLANGTRAR